MTWEVVIGLEVHAQLRTASKAFCGCSTAFGAPPNSNTCPVCLGLPGTLPVLNQGAVRLAMRVALATGCEVRRRSVFARKNYFYPDLPKGYQISQFELPLAEHGSVVVPLASGAKRVRLKRIHMEEDAGKSVHAPPVGSLVDLNRCGVPLVEIVSEPDMSSPEEAAAYLKELHAILTFCGACGGDMEKGEFRCDANVSLRPSGAEALGVRTEIKNVNSFKFVSRALQFEMERQRAVLEAGGRVVQETLHYDPARGVTEAIRSKEEAHDYRYFPDPDLPPLVMDEALIEEARASLPELPAARRQRLAGQFGLAPYDAGVLSSDRALGAYFEEVAARCGDGRRAAAWVTTELLGRLNEDGKAIEQCPVAAAELGDLVRAVMDSRISGRMAKDAFAAMYGSGRKVVALLAEMGEQVSDSASLQGEVDAVVAANSDEVGRYLGGKAQLLGFFVGQVMKRTAGKANPKMASDLVRVALEKKRNG